MKKVVTIIFVLFVGFICVRFLLQNKDTVTGQITEVGSDISPLKDPSLINKVESNNKVKKEMTTAILNTSKGEITIEFLREDAPKTVENFVKLAESHFYDGIKFHRVIKDFMIQTGDPLTKDEAKMPLWGTGGPGYKFADEINSKSTLYTTIGYKKGIVAMANSGPNTNGSQFFIMHQDVPLPPAYTIFGKVVSGQDVVDKIANVKTVNPGVNDRPVDPVIINSITLK